MIADLRENHRVKHERAIFHAMQSDLRLHLTVPFVLMMTLRDWHAKDIARKVRAFFDGIFS
jgi:hypothetical protein